MRTIAPRPSANGPLTGIEPDPDTCCTCELGLANGWAVGSDERMTQADLTTGIAFYGAILATAALTWQIVRELRDRGRLNFWVGFRILVGPGTPSTTVIVLSFTNNGARPLYLSHVALGTGRRATGQLLLPEWPTEQVRLEPGQSWSHRITNWPFLDKDNFSWIAAIDSVGGVHKFKGRALRRLRDEHAKHGGPGGRQPPN